MVTKIFLLVFVSGALGTCIWGWATPPLQSAYAFWAGVLVVLWLGVAFWCCCDSGMPR